MTRGKAPLIFNLGSRWRWEVNFTLRALYPREKIPVPIEQVSGWASENLWTFGEETYFLLLPEFEPWTVEPEDSSLYRIQ